MAQLEKTKKKKGMKRMAFCVEIFCAAHPPPSSFPGSTSSLWLNWLLPANTAWQKFGEGERGEGELHRVCPQRERDGKWD